MKMMAASKEELLSYETAVSLVIETAKPLPKNVASLADSANHALAEDVFAPHPIPSFDSSAVDGYAILLDDVRSASSVKPIRLRIAGEVSAGSSSLPALRKGETVRIFTGAPIPRNAEAVIMREFVEQEKGYALVKASAKPSENIRFAGQEYEKGEKVLRKGVLITPPVSGMLASLGIVQVPVFTLPRVALLTTGNEVVPPTDKPKAGQIRNANLSMLCSALERTGVETVFAEHCGDDPRWLERSLSNALEESDVLLAVGGVSVGDYDYVKSTLLALGVKEIFWRVAIKPGKPLFFGVKGKKLVFGLPGNPVSAMVCFLLFVLPAIRKMMGLEEYETSFLPAELSTGLKKKAGRAEFLRGNFQTSEGGRLMVSPLEAQGSHMLGGLAGANCLIFLGESCEDPRLGSKVKIIPLFWRELL